MIWLLKRAILAHVSVCQMIGRRVTISNHTLVCRHCDSPAIVTGSSSDPYVECPACGIRGRVEEVRATAVEYFQRSVQNSQIHNFQQGVAKSAKRLKNVTYTPGKLTRLTPPDFIYR